MPMPHTQAAVRRQQKTIMVIDFISKMVMFSIVIGGAVMVLVSMAAIPLFLVSPFLYLFTWVTDPKLKNK
jgi:hypothetical protein